MSSIAIKNNTASIVEGILSDFASTIGNEETEVLCWGVKTTPEMQSEIGVVIENATSKVGGKKIHGVKILAKPAVMKGKKTPELKGVPEGFLVYVPNAEEWNQGALLCVMIQAAEAGCKLMIGFNQPSRLSISMYMYTVFKQVNEGTVSAWAVNMDKPVGDI